jgi:cobalt-zinc-cadmium efflux system protein
MPHDHSDEDHHDHAHDHHDHAGHDHGHGHGHGLFGGHHAHAPASFGRAFALGIALNTAYVIVEAIYGLAANSLALVADAGHNFGDVLSLAVAWIAASLARRPPTERYTYGLRGSSILAALSNATLLLVVTGAVAWAAVLKLTHPSPAGGPVIMAVAAAGVAVNGVTALMFAAGRKGDINIRAAFAHMASDALVALGVVAAGGAIWLTGWTWLDPAVSLLIGGLIIAGTWSLMRESLDLALGAVPTTVNRDDILRYLTELPGVSEVHDLHIWGMSTTETALTAHLVRPGGQLDDSLLSRACRDLNARFSVHHATLQVEAGQQEHPCHLAPSEVV